MSEDAEDAVGQQAADLLARLATQTSELRMCFEFEHIAEMEATAAALAADRDVQVAIVRLTSERVAAIRLRLGKPRSRSDTRYMNLHSEAGFPSAAVVLVQRLLRRKLPFTEDDFLHVLNGTADLGMVALYDLRYLPPFVKRLEPHIKSAGLSDAMDTALKRFSKSLAWCSNAPFRKMRTHITILRRLSKTMSDKPKPKPKPKTVVRSKASNAQARPAVKTGPDEFEISPDDLLYGSHVMVSELIGDDAFIRNYLDGKAKLIDSDTGRAIKELDRPSLSSLVAALVARIVCMHEDLTALKDRWEAGGKDDRSFGKKYLPMKDRQSFLQRTLEETLRRKVLLDDRTLIALTRWIARKNGIVAVWPAYPWTVKAIETFADANELSGEVREAIEALRKRIQSSGDREDRKYVERLEAVIGTAPTLMIQPGEAWSDQALADVGTMKAGAQAAWADLIDHCRRASGGKPSAKWLKTASPLLKAVGRKAFVKRVTAWFGLVDKPRTAAIETWSQWEPDPNLRIIDLHADILKGLVWCCGTDEDKVLARVLTALAVSAYRKVPGLGPRATKIGNACVYALGAMTGMDAVGQLALLKVKVKFRPAQKGIDKGLTAAAERAGVPRDELEEMAVPAYGLTEVGRLLEPMGEFTAQLIVTGTSSTELLWLTGDGKRRKSVPAAVTKDHADELKDLKAVAKDIQKMIPAQRERIDGLFLHRKRWPFVTWRERYLDHPLVGTLARRIIWRFTTGKSTAEGIFLDGDLVGGDDCPLAGLGDETTVELWHPIDRPVDEVLAWRAWLERHEVAQPFKQAHREVYLLTDAERRTGVYSNRYAAHIVRQHQFNALCAVRGWRNTLKLLVDDEFPPAWIDLPAWGLRAEFWTDGAGDDYGVDTNETGTFHYLATDQVRFYREDETMHRAHAYGGRFGGAGDPLPVEDVPPLVFSEVMRDADLFVGVASVGNDPTWSDGGPDGRYQDYWQSYSFGDLSGSAQMRKEVLQGLVPRLAIAGLCTFSDKFLVVRGEIRTYKIHLGSGNILMEPNDQYLCIVPGRSTTGKRGEGLFLPFEGDRTLSIILSKALMLAEDTKIKDKTIVGQIRG